MLDHKLFNISFVLIIPDKNIEDMFQALTNGYKIISAKSGDRFVQYILQKEVTKNDN